MGSPFDRRREAHIVVSLQNQDAHTLIGEPRPKFSRVASGSRAGAGRFTQIARHNQTRGRYSAKQRREACDRLVQRMCDYTIAGRISSPFVAQMKVGDHGGVLAMMKGGPFGCELPTVEDRKAQMFQVELNSYAASMTLSGFRQVLGG